MMNFSIHSRFCVPSSSERGLGVASVWIFPQLRGGIPDRFATIVSRWMLPFAVAITICGGTAPKCCGQNVAAAKTDLDAAVHRDLGVPEQLTIAAGEGRLDSVFDQLAVACDTQIVDQWISGSELPSVIGSLYRQLSGLDSEEQFELWSEWTFPPMDSTQGKGRVRMITCPVPTEAPPSVFARTMGKRPREDSFAVASIGGMRGMFCSAWMLVQAADQRGRLSRLISDLEQLVSEGADGAKPLLVLARIADRRGNSGSVRAYLAKVRQDFAANQLNVIPMDADRWMEVAISLAATTREELADDAESTLAVIANRVGQNKAVLRIAHAVAVQTHRGQSDPAVLFDSQMAHWMPAAQASATSNLSGSPQPMWISHEEHILHLAGAGQDVLFYRYPLTGDFDFVCETQEGGPLGTDGGLVYGGLQFQALGLTNELTVWDADGDHAQTRPCPFVRHESAAVFNRVSLHSDDDGLAFESNLHPMWRFGEPEKQSPWLGLRSFGRNRPAFRNFRFTGTPTIPRKVDMIAGEQLRGWQTGFFDESQPTFVESRRGLPDAKSSGSVDYRVQEGILTALVADTESKRAMPGLIRYQRPLMDGESISYQFKHSDDEVVLHPALGRMVFLLESGGIRIRWMTDGPFDWTGLPQDNTLLEPLNRKGPRPIPLQEGDWNRVSIARVGQSVTVALNGEPIYQRPVDFSGAMPFGFYRADRSKVGQVRNVEMTGDWPETLPESFFGTEEPRESNLGGPVQPTRAGRGNTVDEISSVVFVDEQTLSDNVRAVCAQATNFDPQERYDYLADWVLPGDRHRGLRLAGYFSPVEISEPAAKEAMFAIQTPPRSNLTRSAHPVFFCPAVDLIDAAQWCDRLPQLFKRVDAFDPQGDRVLTKQKLALTAITLMAMGNSSPMAAGVKNAGADQKPLLGNPAVTERLGRVMVQFLKLCEDPEPLTDRDRWAEYLVAYVGMSRAASNQTVDELLSFLFESRVRLGGDRSSTLEANLQSHLQRLVANRRHERGNDRQRESLQSELDRSWVASGQTNARLCGLGRALPEWELNANGELEHLVGHESDLLLYRSPLAGNFSVHADLHPWSRSQVQRGDHHVGNGINREHIQIGSFRHPHQNVALEKPFEKPGRWVRFRSEFQDGHQRDFLDGRLVHKRNLVENEDPWLGLRSWWKVQSRVNEVSISGRPTILDQVPIGKSSDLIGWTSYFQNSIATKNAPWQQQSEGDHDLIVGLRRGDVVGCDRECLLQYHRRMVEDGAFAFDFYYDQANGSASPAIGRLAFLLRPDGVYEHWVTDGQFDPTGVRPGNLQRIQSHQRWEDSGDPALPLKKEAWNHLEMRLQGDEVSLFLNDHRVFQRTLPSNSRRSVGLFHFADRSQLRVRNAILRGDWPKQMPPDQPLADPRLKQLDLQLSALPAVAKVNFQDPSTVDSLVDINKGNAAGSTLDVEGGKRVTATSSGAWIQTAMKPRFSLSGNFDVQVGFIDARCDSPVEQGMAELVITVADQDASELHVAVGTSQQSVPFLRGQKIALNPDGSRRFLGERWGYESESGRMRIVRKGDTAYFLFASGVDGHARVIGQQPIGPEDINFDSIKLTVTAKGQGVAGTVWTDMTIAADRIQHLPGSNLPLPPMIGVVDAATGRVTKLAGPTEGFNHVGSPTWSQDGKWITYDQSLGSVAKSRLMMVPFEGGDPIDLGFGSMPSFSKDGRRVAFSAYQQGVGIMNVDGSERKILDVEGWGAEWSPDGKTIAYGKRGNIVLWDVATGTSRSLMVGAADRFSLIYWNMCWSPDSSKIQFHARKTGSNAEEFAVVDLAHPSQVKSIAMPPNYRRSEVGWSPSDDRLLVALTSNTLRYPQLFTMPADGSDVPAALVPRVDNHEIAMGAWSPDGKWIAVRAVSRPEALDWPLRLPAAGE
ncbi:translocation protein TolB [Rubripirellula lacrimiformis]|uniref:Translocation protein TolB n=1 Tax=Rubripirellula lacrimiformis TaxID=1930273 RepID=A0A517NC62_9BACT|nr:DUF1583 domain-containing protein [Rubripirellula lacrimiformis]QDT04608.1 translocation protein TolB [Rubripirellula lacrimiformis]